LSINFWISFFFCWLPADLQDFSTQEHLRGFCEVLEKPDSLSKAIIIKKLRKCKNIRNLHQITEIQNLPFIFSTNVTFSLLDE